MTVMTVMTEFVVAQLLEQANARAKSNDQRTVCKCECQFELV